MKERVPHGSVVKCLTRNPGSWVRATLDPLGFSWECPWARHFRAKPSNGETQESMNNVSCRHDMTEILLKRRITTFNQPNHERLLEKLYFY